MNEQPSAKLLPSHLSRRAVVYVRQSSQYQVQHNTESQRRQYDLAVYGRSLGFIDVVTIHEYLGRSGGGQIERPGFSRLVTMVCGGEVGAVFALGASRLARNGRDWHQLIELCGFSCALGLISRAFTTRASATIDVSGSTGASPPVIATAVTDDAAMEFFREII